MAIPGVVLLTFMSVHLFQFRLDDTQTNSIWATFARQVASRSRVRHSALPVALRRHGLTRKSPAALRHARLTQSGHDLHVSFDTVPTSFEQAGEIPHLAARDGRTGRFYRPAASFGFSRRHVFVTSQLPLWFPDRIMVLRDGGHSTMSTKTHAKQVYDPAVSLDNSQIINQVQLVTVLRSSTPIRVT